MGYIINDIEKIVKDTPNDQELGKKIREYLADAIPPDTDEDKRTYSIEKQYVYNERGTFRGPGF